MTTAAKNWAVVRTWALRMAQQCSTPGNSETNWPRAATYLELAALVDHEQERDHK